MKHAQGKPFETTSNPFKAKWGANMKINDSKKAEQIEEKNMIPEKKSTFDIPCAKCGKPSDYHNGYYDTDYRKGEIMFLCSEHQKEFSDLIKNWRQ